MRKYYADIDLYFDNRKYGIVGDITTNRKEMIELLESFAKNFNLKCNAKSKKFFDKQGKEVGSFTLASKTI